VLIRDVARRLADHRHVEWRLFEVVGGWAVGAPPAVAALLHAESHHHAWHASLFDERVPVLHDLPPDALLPPVELDALLDAVAAPEELLERLVGLVRVVLPEQLARYQADLDAASAVSDAPVVRALRLVVEDVAQDWRAAALVLRSLVVEEEAVERAAAHQLRLERVLLAASKQRS
jgi:hypothetical protein